MTDHPYSPRPEDPGGNCACGLPVEDHDPPMTDQKAATDEPRIAEATKERIEQWGKQARLLAMDHEFGQEHIARPDSPHHRILALIARIEQEQARRARDQRYHKKSADRLAKLLDPHMPVHDDEMQEVELGQRQQWCCRHCHRVTTAPVRPAYDPCPEAPDPHNKQQATIDKWATELPELRVALSREVAALRAANALLGLSEEKVNKQQAAIEREKRRANENLALANRLADDIERLERQIESPKFLESLVLDQEARIDGEVKWLRAALEEEEKRARFIGALGTAGRIRAVLKGEKECGCLEWPVTQCHVCKAEAAPAALDTEVSGE